MPYTPPVNDQTYYVTKYALTGGIVKVKGHLCESRRTDGTLIDDYGGKMVSVVWVAGEYRLESATFHNPEWHTTLEAAQARVEEMKAAKLKSLRKQVAKLETLSVSFMPVDDRTALAEKPEAENGATAAPTRRVPCTHHVEGQGVNILQGDEWKIDGATWAVTSVDTLRSTCCISGPLPCRGMQTMALSVVAAKGTLVRRAQ